jgi:hypothetical protein
MRLALFMLLAALCGGCASPSTPVDKRVGRSEFTLRVQLMDRGDAHPVCAQVVRALMPLRDRQINGCFEWDDARQRCTIWVVEPEVVEDQHRMAVIGHEVWHCVRGLYHP